MPMNHCTDLCFLSTIACQIAECVPDNKELIVLATSLTALGDMLSFLFFACIKLFSLKIVFLFDIMLLRREM